MKAADKRKKDYERRVEKKVQKEREQEEGMYADKEAFVTSAYREKMKRMEEEEEEEERRARIEGERRVEGERKIEGENADRW